MLFINFLCLLYLMVLSNSHTISKSIDIDDGLDEVSDTISNLDNTKHHRSRRDRIHNKYRIQGTPVTQLDAITEAEIFSKPSKSAERAHSDTINLRATTANPKYTSHKRKFGGFWRKFKGKYRKTTENAQKRHVVKNNRHGWWKHERKRQPLYFTSDSGRNKRKHKDPHNAKQSEISSTKNADVAINVPIKKMNNNVRVFTPYVMFATKPSKGSTQKLNKVKNKKTTENILNAIANMNTQLSNLKRKYGVTTTERSIATKTSTYDYPRTAEIEELLTGIKMKAIQTVVDSGPAMVNVISNTVTEATFRASNLSKRIRSLAPRYAVSTLYFDNIFNNEQYYGQHKLATRSINGLPAINEPLSISTIEEMLQKEIKTIYNKMKSQVSKELPKFRLSTHKTTTSTAICTKPAKTSTRAQKTVATTTTLATTAPTTTVPTTTLPTTTVPKTTTTPTTMTTITTTPTTTTTSTTTTSTPSTTISTASTTANMTTSTLSSPKSKVQNSKSTTPGFRFKTSTKPPVTYEEKSSDQDKSEQETSSEQEESEQDKAFEKDELLSRLVRDKTSASVNEMPDAESSTNADDYNMLNLYEQMLEKVQEDNAMRMMATSNLPSSLQKRDRCRLSKRNPETLTDIELQESVQTLYNDVIIPDYEYIKSMSTSTTAVDEDNQYETNTYDILSKKIAYDDFVNGYKHYLKFQQEKAKADNFSAIVKYQAHRHHNVDDIGKYILDKIPQLPQESTSEAGISRLKRFFEDVDMEDQEVSTKTDDSWFRKHFYIFLDYGPPKKFHTSQIVALKPPTADIGQDYLQSTKTIKPQPSSSLSNVFVRSISNGEVSMTKQSQSTAKVNLDDLARSLDIIKSSTMRNTIHKEIEKHEKKDDSTTEETMSFRELPLKKMNRLVKTEQRRELVIDLEVTTKPVNATGTYLPDRYKRANESIAEDFVNKEIEEKSSTPVKEVLADVGLHGKNKSEHRFGCVDVNLVPASPHAANLHVNNTKSKKKSKFRAFLKRFHFKSKNKQKRSCTNRPPRFNPFRSLKNIFRPTTHLRKKPPKKNTKTTAHGTSTPTKTKLNSLNLDMVDSNPNENQKFTKASDMQKAPKFQLTESNFGLADSIKTFPPMDTSTRTGKPLTFLMMLDDGSKKLWLKPGTFHKSTGKTKPLKLTRTLKTDGTTKSTKRNTDDESEVLTVNVKTLKPLPSVVMKALTSTASNETLPDLNLEIAKVQYGILGTNQQAKPALSNSMFFRRSGSHLPLGKHIIKGLAFNNHLTRIGKLSVPQTRYSDSRQNMNLSEDPINAPDYQMGNEDLHDSIGKLDERFTSTKGFDKSSKNIDYFNDLLLWNNDILTIDKVPQPSWRDIVKNVEKDFGTTEYTTPNMLTMMNELKEMDKSFKELSNKKKLYHPKSENPNFDDELHVAMNQKALVKSKDFVIKGEQKYFQYNKPNLSLHNLGPFTSATIFPLFSKKPKQTVKAPIAWTGKPPRLDFTVQSPISWVSSEPKEDEPTINPISFSPPDNPPTIWCPDRHIAWTSGKKKSEEVWTLQSPISWNNENPPTKPQDDCLAKLARKFYIGIPKNPPALHTRLMRLTSTAEDGMVQSTSKTKKPAMYENADGIYPTTGKPAETDMLEKSEKSAKTGKPKTSHKTDKFTELNGMDTPALMVDTTLLSYDDEVETVTNGLEVKKLTRHSQDPSKSDKLSKSKFSHHRKTSDNIIAKTNKRPQMYYSTPLPMKPSDFNKFLKDQGMDVESVISPLYGQTSLYHAWPTLTRPPTIRFTKTPVPSAPTHSSSVTKISNFFSKYSTQLEKLRHKQNKFQGQSLKTKNEKIKLTEKPMVKNSAKQPKPNKASLNRDPKAIKRIEKLKMFRQKYYDIESTTKPKTESNKEEIFSPELQAKLEHSQEPKHISRPKDMPKSNSRTDPKLWPQTFEHKSEPKLQKLDNTSVYTLTTNTEFTPTTTEGTTIVSTLEPEPDESMPEPPIELRGSMIFTSKNPHNKDVDITIINFDDLTKKNINEFSSGIEDLHDISEHLGGSKFSETSTAKLRRTNFRQTTNTNSHWDKVSNERILYQKGVSNEAMDPYTDKVLLDESLENLDDISTTKRSYNHDLLNDLEKNQGLLNPKRVQISSHHYKYDILYKNTDRQKQANENFEDNGQERRLLLDLSTDSVTPSGMAETTLDTGDFNHLLHKPNTLRKYDMKERLKRKNRKSLNRKWFTVDTKFRYVRNLDPQGDNADRGKENDKKIDAERTLNKRFFGFTPRFYVDKLHLKRMNTSPNKKKESKGNKSTTTGSWFTKTQMLTEESTALNDPYKTSLGHQDNDQNAALEGFSIQIGNKKIQEAVDKIKSMTTENLKDFKEGLEGISDKLGFSHKTPPKQDLGYFMPTISKELDNFENIDSTDQITLSEEPPIQFKPKPSYNDYPETLHDPQSLAKSAHEKAISNNFEQSIFDKSMYGKHTFDQGEFEKVVFGTGKYPTTTKSSNDDNTYNILTDIMSYDVTADGKTDKVEVEYDEAGLLPDHVNVDSPTNTAEVVTNHKGKVTKNQNYIFDSASIIYNKSFLHPIGIPDTKLLVFNSDKKDKTSAKPWLPVAGNTLSVLFRNPVEGHLGFGLKPVVQVSQPITSPKLGQSINLQIPPMPSPMDIMQAQMAQRQMAPAVWPVYQGGGWPQMQATSMGYPMETGIKMFNSNETYGIYVEPGVFSYDQQLPFGHEKLYVDVNNVRNKKKNVKAHLTTKYKISKYGTTLKNVQLSLKMLYNKLPSTSTPIQSKTTSKNPFTACMTTGKHNYNTKSKDTDSKTSKHRSVAVQNIPNVSHTNTNKQHNMKRDLQGQDTYTAKDVAALEVIVDLMKNTLGYEEKDLGSIMTTNPVHPMKSVHQGPDTTNSIQVHIAIPYDVQNTKKRSPLEPVRVRKVFSAKMSTPVDLEYQVHSFEGSFQTAGPTVSTGDDGLSPGMYLLIDKPKNGYALKPVKTNIDFSQINSRQSGNIPVLEYKGETTLRDHNMKNIAKVTLSKNFISAFNRQLVELYENLTKHNIDDPNMRMRRHIYQTTKAAPFNIKKHVNNVNKKYNKRSIDWEAVKKYFGFERICNCKCKPYKPMCRACAASDAVIDELTFEFDNLGKYMRDHCTEIQTYFWVNPSGGVKLRDAVDRINTNLHDYSKRSKGKCQGRTCETLGNHIEKKRFIKNSKVEHKSRIKNFIDDLLSVAYDLNRTLDMNTCYNEKLIEKGAKMMNIINSCFSQKPFHKRSDTEATRKKFVKNVYSLDNINVNIICNPEISSSAAEAFETPTTHNLVTMTTPKLQEHTLTLDNLFEFEFDNLKNQNKLKGFKRFFLKRNNKKDKLFTYYTIKDIKTSKLPFKRAADDIPLIADSGGTFWLEYLKAATTSQPLGDKQLLSQNEPKLDVAVVQSNDLKNGNSVNGKAINTLRNPENDIPIMTLNIEKNSVITADSAQNLHQLLNLLERLENIKDNNNQNFSVFSKEVDAKQCIRIKSMRPLNATKISTTVCSSKNGSSFATSKSLRNLTDVHSSTTLLTTKSSVSLQTTSPFSQTSRSRFSKTKTFNVTKPSIKTTSDIFAPTQTSSKPPVHTTMDIDTTSTVIDTTLPAKTVSETTQRANTVSDITHPVTTVSSSTIYSDNTISENISPNNTRSDTMSTANTLSEIKAQANISSETTSPGNLSLDFTDSDKVYQDSILSETKSLDNESQTTPIDLADSETETTSIDITLDDSTDLTENEKDVTSSDDIYSDIISPFTVLRGALSQDKNLSVSEQRKLTDNLFLSSPFFKSTTPSTTLSMRDVLKDIEHMLYKKKFGFTFSTEPTTKASFLHSHFSTGKKNNKAPSQFENYLISTGAILTKSDKSKGGGLFGQSMIKKTFGSKQKLTKATQKHNVKPLTTVTKTTTASTRASTKKATRKGSKSGLLQRITSASKFLGLGNNFYLLRKKNPDFGHSDVIIDNDLVKSAPAIKSTAPGLHFNDFSQIRTYGTPTVVIINDYDRLTENLHNQHEENSEKYKNLLLSVIQYETNRLNNEWQRIAYKDAQDYGSKRSITIPGGTIWKSTLRTVLENNVSGTPEPPKRKGLLNKLASKIGIKGSARKKVAHSRSPNFPVSSNYTTFEELMTKTLELRHATTPTVRPRPENKATRVSSIEKPARMSKQKKAIKTTEAGHFYPPIHTVCDLQATFKHITERRQELEDRAFEAYVKDVPCQKYNKLPRNFLITHKTRIPKWDWIRNKRSSVRFDRYEKSEEINDLYCEKFETFVKDHNGIYRIVDRKKRDTSRSLSYQLKKLPPLKLGKSELYVMAGDSVTLDCPLQPQRSPYSQYIWGADPKDLLDCDNVHVDGFTLVIRKVGPRNAGRYSCSVDDVVRRSTKVSVLALPAVDVVFLPTYKTQRQCNYDDLKAVQQLGREMSKAARCGNICSIRIDEPMCQRDNANRSLIRSTGVLTMSPKRVKCSVQCRRDLFSSMLRLAIANIPSVTNTGVILSKDGVNETLKPWYRVGRPTITHTLRKKDSSGHFEYHKFSTAAKPGHMSIVIICDPGYYLLDGQHVCAPCPANTSASLGDNMCAACAPGLAAPPGAAQCHSVARRLRRYDWWWYPPCGYMVAFGGLVCACGLCAALALLVHAVSRAAETPARRGAGAALGLRAPATMEQHLTTGFMHSAHVRPLSPSRVILARFFKQSLPSSRGTVVDSQETRFELWKEKNIPPLPPAIDFDMDTS